MAAKDEISAAEQRKMRLIIHRMKKKGGNPRRNSMARDCEIILKISPFWRNFQAMNLCKWGYRQWVTGP